MITSIVGYYTLADMNLSIVGTVLLSSDKLSTLIVVVYTENSRVNDMFLYMRDGINDISTQDGTYKVELTGIDAMYMDMSIGIERNLAFMDCVILQPLFY